MIVILKYNFHVVKLIQVIHKIKSNLRSLSKIFFFQKILIKRFIHFFEASVMKLQGNKFKN